MVFSCRMVDDFANPCSQIKRKERSRDMKKTRREFLKTAGAAALGTGAVLSVPKMANAQAKTFKWKMATIWPSGQPGYFSMAKVHADTVKRISNGRLQIETFPAGAIAPVIEIVDAVRRGVCEIGLTWPG